MRRKSIIIVSILVVIVVIVIGIDIVKASPVGDDVMLNSEVTGKTVRVDNEVERAEVRGLVSGDLYVEVTGDGVTLAAYGDVFDRKDLVVNLVLDLGKEVPETVHQYV